MSDTIECEIYLAINSEGEWACSSDEQDATDNVSSSGATRIVKFTVNIKAPIATEIAINVPDQKENAPEITVTA